MENKGRTQGNAIYAVARSDDFEFSMHEDQIRISQQV